jgi:CTP:molybdopterin cytidylyltransferase MocA
VVFLLSDLDLPLRDRTYREPDGPHVVVVRGRDLDAALDHLDARPDCRALAVIGLPEDVPDLDLLIGRRLLVCDSDRARMREFAEAGMSAGADVEWLNTDRPDLNRLATWALPVGAVVLGVDRPARRGGSKLLLDVGGKPLVRHVVSAASDGGCHLVHVVYTDEAVRDAVAGSAHCVYRPEGRGRRPSHLQLGLQSLPEDMAAALVMLGDQPLIGPRTVSLLLRAWRREGARPAVAAAYGERSSWQAPLLIDRSLWAEVADLEGEGGARSLFDQRPELLDTVLAAGYPDDADTPEDHAKIVHLFPRPSQG